MRSPPRLPRFHGPRLLPLLALTGAIALCLGMSAPLFMSTPAQEGAGGPATPSSIVRVPRTDGAAERQTETLRRVLDAKEPASVVFLGDSITQGWEGAGKSTWDASIAPLKAVNLGVSGDRTEHVLWRLAAAPLKMLQPKAIVVMIGTNNLGHGSSNAEETLLGVRTIVDTIRSQCPTATILLCGIFPRGERFNPMRGDICQINQALQRLAGDRVVVADFGHRFLRDDGSISTDIMPDHLHLSPAGYAIWAEETLPILKRLLNDSK
jgi:lysophospholipase L1-like esterase